MTSNTQYILVIEDDPAIRRFLRVSLSSHGFDAAEAASGKEAMILLGQRTPDLVILDLGLPDMDGLEIITQFRGWSQAPIVVVSARGQEKDKVAALDAGADDYLTKPFAVGELMARVRVALRHAAAITAGESNEASHFCVGDLQVDLAMRRVFVAGSEVHLTPIEYKLLATLVHHAGKVLTHQFLMKEVWGTSYLEQTHYLRIFMANIRRKLEKSSTEPRYLLTEQGVGYRLATEE